MRHFIRAKFVFFLSSLSEKIKSKKKKKKIGNINNEKVFSFEKIEKPFRIISGIAISSRIRARREHSRFQRKVGGSRLSDLVGSTCSLRASSSTTGYLQSAVYSLFLL